MTTTTRPETLERTTFFIGGEWTSPAGAGTIDVIAPGAEVVAAGAGELLTAAAAETLEIPRAGGGVGQAGPVPAGGRRAAVRGRGRPPRFP